MISLVRLLEWPLFLKRMKLFEVDREISGDFS